MSWSIRIGEAVIDDETYHATVHAIEIADAPLFDEDTGRTNYRAPGYNAWASFVDDLGLREEFFGIDGLMRDRDIAPLTADNLAAFERARDAYALQQDRVEMHEHRINWLIWWTRWALNTCKRPAIRC